LEVPNLPFLYSFRRCPYAMRARLALLVSGANCEVREVRLSNKPPELIAVSPKATVPVLVLPDGRVIDESIDIMLWALNEINLKNNRHAELVSASYLLSTLKSKTLKRVQGDDTIFQHDNLIAQNDGPFKHHLDRYKYPEKYGSDANEHRAEGEAILSDYEALLGQSPYLSGTKPGLTDYALLPFIRQFAHVDREYFYALPTPHLHAWLTAQLESTLFGQVMAHYPVWTQGDEASFLMSSTEPDSRHAELVSASTMPPKPARE
jgi:glutathione S-transferase